MTCTAEASGERRTRRSPAAIAVALATILALVGLAVGLFFNPLWIAFEQDRTRADLWTGYPPPTVHAVTDSVVGEVFLGPGTFAQAVAGVPVFNERERAHMADVHRVVVVFVLLVVVAIGLNDAQTLSRTASSTGPVGPSIVVIRLVFPLGRTTISSPGRSTPLATVPA